METPAPEDSQEGERPLPPEAPSAESSIDEDEPIVELNPFEIEAFFSGEGLQARPDISREASPEQDVEPEGRPAAIHLDPSESAALDPDFPVIPGFRIEGLIGRGATGVVYRARQTAVDRAVALKVLHSELIANPRAVKRLKREARLAAKLAHPSIISAIDMGSVGGLWWYAMELVEGVPMSRRIAERRSLSERECLRLFSPLCDALQHAHEVGVVHRDIKPANILIDQRGRARLVDLGLAMSENDPSITRTGTTLGTPHYVSPEQARDPSQADIRSDLWSLGATMYHAICGHPPFHSDEPESGGVAEILSRVLYEPIIDPREFAPSLSKGFSLVLRKCLTRDPSQRYQEPWELVADIELLRERRRVDVSASQLDSYASRRQDWVVPALLVAGLFTAIGGTWLLTARPWEEQVAPVVIERMATLSDWPALEAVRNGFDSGALTPADALEELDTPALLDLPESAQYLRNKLVVDVRAVLDERLRSFMESTDRAVDEALEARDFQLAATISDDSFSSRLRAATGYGTLAELPKGSSQRRALDWRAATQQRVASERIEALRTAEQGLITRYGMLANAELDKALGVNRWRDAIEWLNPDDPEVWLTRAAELGTSTHAGGEGQGGGGAHRGVDGARLAAFDLSGLTSEERRRLVRVIEGQVRSAESQIKYRVGQALSDVRQFVQFQAGRLREEIEESTLRGDESVVDQFDAAVEAKHASENLDLEQLPEEFARSYGDEIVKARDDLAYAEKRAQESLAELGVEQLDASALPLLEARDYGAARALYLAAREEGWRRSTFDLLDLRLREMEILGDVLQRAAAGVEAASGDRRELTFGQIPRLGRIDARAGEVLRLGFVFVPEFGTDGRILILLRGAGVDGTALGSSRLTKLLETEDLLEFAGLGVRGTRAVGAAELQPGDALAAAAFLRAEGRHGRAHALLRLEDYPADEGLAADLERRARRAAVGTRAEGPTRDEGAEAPEGAGRTAPRPRPADARSGPGGTSALSSDGVDAARRERAAEPFLEFFGTPNQAVNARDVHLVWRMAIDSQIGGDRLRFPVPAGDDRANGWNLKRWRLEADGMELISALSEVTHFAQDVGPSLPLGAPLDIDRRIRLDVDLLPGNERPDGHIVGVSLRGYHALIARNKIWFGGGNLHDLYEFVRRRGRGKHEGFEVRPCPPLVEGQLFHLTIEISPGALDKLDVNGESLQFNRFLTEPDRPDSFVRIRSLRPMAVGGVELRGDREH
ncbi:Serine/threonine-protein kinase PrkC [Planctomycetes bacterium Poly30]|uniref:Serine/threonine-protein kinase PrkC n=1 Tax=Saltatorellus ferox TaxID=2528018 RepID=A0A518ER85_9BACT|nr:Serine/threonine-protein kinase PrkC [Planctomycetes bacterium Poly30]